VVFIVQGKPREPEGIVKVTRATRKDALQTANEFLNQGIPFVTIIADGRVDTTLSAAYPQPQKLEFGWFNSDLLRTNSQAVWRAISRL